MVPCAEMTVKRAIILFLIFSWYISTPLLIVIWVLPFSSLTVKKYGNRYDKKERSLSQKEKGENTVLTFYDSSDRRNLQYLQF